MCESREDKQKRARSSDNVVFPIQSRACGQHSQTKQLFLKNNERRNDSRFNIDLVFIEDKEDILSQIYSVLYTSYSITYAHVLN